MPGTSEVPGIYSISISSSSPANTPCHHHQPAQQQPSFSAGPVDPRTWDES